MRHLLHHHLHLRQETLRCAMANLPAGWILKQDLPTHFIQSQHFHLQNLSRDSPKSTIAETVRPVPTIIAHNLSLASLLDVILRNLMHEIGPSHTVLITLITPDSVLIKEASLTFVLYSREKLHEYSLLFYILLCMRRQESLCTTLCAQALSLYLLNSNIDFNGFGIACSIELHTHGVHTYLPINTYTIF